MPHFIDDKPRGTRKVSNVIVAPVTGAAIALYQLTVGGQNPRTVIVRKVMIFTDVGNVTVTIGQGLAGAFAAILPPFYALNLLDSEWTEDEIPEFEGNADITVESDIANPLVMIEVEEIGE